MQETYWEGASESVKKNRLSCGPNNACEGKREGRREGEEEEELTDRNTIPWQFQPGQQGETKPKRTIKEALSLAVIHLLYLLIVIFIFVCGGRLYFTMCGRGWGCWTEGSPQGRKGLPPCLLGRRN